MGRKAKAKTAKEKAPRRARNGAAPKVTQDETQLTRGELAAMRFAAGTLYAMDIIGCISVPQMAERKEFQGVHVQTLYRWCEADGWVARRKEHQDRMRQELEMRVRDQLMTAQMDQLTKMETLFKKGLQTLESGDCPGPKSWEGVTGVVIKLAKHMLDVRGSILAPMLSRLDAAATPQPAVDAEAPKADKPALPQETLPQLSDEELRAMAHAVMKQRALPAQATDEKAQGVE